MQRKATTLDPVVSLKALDMGFNLAGDEQEAKQRVPDKVSFTKIDFSLVQQPQPQDEKDED